MIVEELDFFEHRHIIVWCDCNYGSHAAYIVAAIKNKLRDERYKQEHLKRANNKYSTKQWEKNEKQT